MSFCLADFLLPCLVSKFEKKIAQLDNQLWKCNKGIWFTYVCCVVSLSHCAASEQVRKQTGWGKTSRGNYVQIGMLCDGRRRNVITVAGELGENERQKEVEIWKRQLFKKR